MTTVAVKPTLPLDPAIIQECVQLIAAGQQPDAGRALRTLREATGMGQSRLASLFHRKAPTICSWELGQKWPSSPELLPGILNALGVPHELIAKAFTVEVDGDLDARLYMRGDSTMIEYGYFLKRRGKVLQRIGFEAERGSVEHAKLFRTWMLDIERRVEGSETKPKQVSDSTTSQTWTTQALKAPKLIESHTTTSSKSDDDHARWIDPYSQGVEE